MTRLKIGPIEAEWDRTLAETAVELEQAGVPRNRMTPPRQVPERRQSVDVRGDPMGSALTLLSQGHPNAAVMDAFTAIEAKLHTLLMEAGVSVTRLHVGGARLAKLAVEEKLISEETLRAIEGLATLRNLAAHGRGDLSTDRALEYLTLAEAVMYAVDNR